MEERTVDCIKREDPDDINSKITHLGGVKEDGARWEEDSGMVIAWIIAKRYIYFVEENGERIPVKPVFEQPPYLRTERDGKETNNLENLPDCSLIEG